MIYYMIYFFIVCFYQDRVFALMGVLNGRLSLIKVFYKRSVDCKYGLVMSR